MSASGRRRRAVVEAIFFNLNTSYFLLVAHGEASSGQFFRNLLLVYCFIEYVHFEFAPIS